MFKRKGEGMEEWGAEGVEEIYQGSIHVVAYRFLTFLFLIVDIYLRWRSLDSVFLSLDRLSWEVSFELM